jgi:putative membrane protein
VHGWFGYGYGSMGLWWLFWATLIIAGVWALVRSSRRSWGGGGAPESAEDVVKRRYAKGEIDRDTFRRMLADLHGREAAP